jgi:hypothetical protein
MGRRKAEQTKQVTNEPWSASQPYLQDVMDTGQFLHDSGAGQNYYPGDTYAGMGADAQSALTQMAGLASQPIAGLQQAQNAMGNIASTGGIDTGAQYQQMLDNGAWRNPSTSMYQDLYSQAQQPNAANQYLEPTAQGQYLDNRNPYLADLYGRGADDLTNRMKSLYEGHGRYGSGSMNTDLANSLGGLYTGIMAPAYESERNRMLEASSLLGNFNQAGFGNRLGALQGLNSAEQQQFSNRSGLLGNLSDVQAMNAGNQMQAASMVPGLDAARYAGVDRLTQIGAARQSDRQASLDADIARFNFEQQAPWEAAQQYSNLLGMGGSPGFGSETTYEQPPSRLAGMVGGAGQGFNIGSKFGAPGWGAAIGAGLGFFGA